VAQTLARPIVTDAQKCKRCGAAKTHRPEDFDLFEGMHWICFHLEFEHSTDPDVACSDPSCPWWHIEVFRAELARRGVDPDDVLERALKARLQ